MSLAGENEKQNEFRTKRKHNSSTFSVPSNKIRTNRTKPFYIELQLFNYTTDSKLATNKSKKSPISHLKQKQSNRTSKQVTKQAKESDPGKIEQKI